jgi:hypothetical protein
VTGASAMNIEATGLNTGFFHHQPERMPYAPLLLLKRPPAPIDIIGNMLLKCADLVVVLEKSSTFHAISH